MKPSNVWFTVAGTAIAMHQLLFEVFGGWERISHNAMTGKPTLVCCAVAAGAAFMGWRVRRS
jgi:hypothetical protein